MGILENEHEKGLLTKKLKNVNWRQVKIGIDDEKRHVLVEQNPGVSTTNQLEIMDGLKIQPINKLIDNENKIYFIISCEKEYKPIFPPFVVDFLVELKENDPNIAFHKAHSKAKKYWKGRKPPLTSEQQKGLIGEIIILNELASRSSFEKIIEKWTGPLDMLHDLKVDQ